MSTEDIQEQKTVFFRKTMADYKKTGRITECFYHDKLKCNGKIKQSHSLQRNGRLSIIEGPDSKGNQVIYTFTEMEADEKSMFASLKPIGKGVASTFFGFCDHHDTTLFSTIENFPFDNSDQHCFLHTYRSFAHSYHMKKEHIKASSADTEYARTIPKYVFADMIWTAKMGMAELEIEKLKLDKMIENREHNGLEYLIYQLPQKFPIACSSIISPKYSYYGKPMNNHVDPNIPFSTIMLTVLPDVSETIIILACFPEDEKAKNLFDELDTLKPLQFEKAISSLMTNNAENTFFTFFLWNALGKKGQRQLCNEWQYAASSSVKSAFVHSKINFFDSQFSAKSLGIK